MKNMKKWIVLQLVLCSCAGVSRHNQPGNSSSNQPVDQKNHNGVGPNLNQQPNASANVPLANPGATIVTAPNPAHRPKIAIILSPGGMRAMATWEY